MYFIINTLPPSPVINRKSFSPPYLGLISLSQPCFSSSEINWVDNHLSTSPNYISRCTSFFFTSTPTSHHLYEASLKELGSNSLSLQTLVSPHWTPTTFWYNSAISSSTNQFDRFLQTQCQYDKFLHKTNLTYQSIQPDFFTPSQGRKVLFCSLICAQSFPLRQLLHWSSALLLSQFLIKASTEPDPTQLCLLARPPALFNLSQQVWNQSNVKC